MSATPGTMKAIVPMRHGELDALEYRTDWPVPLPSGREVLIRLAASGLNNTDVNPRTGWYRRRARGPRGTDGHLHMPNAPGLGVHPDEKALGHPVAVYT
jgi:NADPH:quinone reductase-like Zn-dependent oxidoreductase